MRSPEARLSRSDRCIGPLMLLAGIAIAIAVAVACVALAGSANAADQLQPDATPQQVQLAMDRLRADPNLPRTETTKALRFKNFEDAPDASDAEDAAEAKRILEWVRNLVAAVAEGTRFLAWGLGALAVVIVLVGARRWIKVRADSARPHVGLPPSHVGSLDIRPESFPPRIGAAAAALWKQGQQRAALSLLYRGALSRAVHLHAVPIRGASTEGDALALASGRLAPAPLALFARLVAAWQLAAYGGRLPDTAMAVALCTDFDLYFGHPAPAEAATT